MSKKVYKSIYPGGLPAGQAGVTLFATGIPLGAEYSANKENTPELPVLISVTIVSSNAK